MSESDRPLVGMRGQHSLYDVLGVRHDASRKELATARRRLAAQWHPDRNPEARERATDHLSAVNAAYDVLADPAKRRRYDEQVAATGELRFEFVCGEITVIAANGQVRYTRGRHRVAFARSSINRVLVRGHVFAPRWATLILMTAHRRHRMRLPADAAKALAAALLRD